MVSATAWFFTRVVGDGEEEVDEDLCRDTRAVDLTVTRGYIARRVSARDCNGVRH